MAKNIAVQPFIGTGTGKGKLFQGAAGTANGPGKISVAFPKNKKLYELYNLSFEGKINAIKGGISKQQLTAIKSEIKVDYDELSEVLGTSRATLINKKKSQKFDAQVSERLFLLLDVLGYGREVFGDNEKFNEWLKTPSEALGNETPFSMM